MLTQLLLLFVLKAFARDEAFQRRVLTRVDPMKFSAGTCPGNPVPAPRLPDAEASDMINRLVRDGELTKGFLAARDIYQLADLEAKSTGAQFVSGMRDFFGHVPRGYDLYFFFADPDSGLKYMILQPATDQLPWILGIAGTQTVLDWIGDLNLGRSQIERIGRINAMFMGCQYLDPHGRPLASHRWIFAGHSLGGGIAQAIAYNVQRTRIAAGLNPLSLRLVTFNGFGAQPLFPDYDERVARTMSVANFFVQGDEVSRIGQHIGPTYALAAPGGSFVQRHSMAMIESLVAVSDGGLVSGLGRAPALAPPERKQLRMILPAASWLSQIVAAGWGENADDRVIARLRVDVAAVLALDLRDPVNAKVLDYTRQLLISRQLDLTEKSPNLKRQTYLAEIKGLDEQLEAKRKSGI